MILLPVVVAAQRQATDTVPTPLQGRRVQTDSLFYEAIKAKELDDEKLATSLFEEFVVRKPTAAGGWFELAKLYRGNQQKEKAEEAIRKAVKLDGENKWYKTEYASILGEEGDFEGAGAIMADLVKTEPEDEDYPLLAADYYERAKKPEVALKFLDKALLHHNNDPEITLHKVQLYLGLNDVAHAAECVQTLIQAEPHTGKYIKMLSELYENNRMPEQAGEVLEKGYKTLPDDPYVQMGYADHYLRAGDTIKYKNFVKQAITNREFDQELQLKLLDAYLQNMANDSQANAEGLMLISELVEQHPNDADIQAFYGDFLESNNQRPAALAAYKKSVAINSSKFNVWLKLLQSFSDKRDADSLLHYSEKTLKLFPNQALAHFYNGIAHLNKQQYAQAIKAINRAIDLQPDGKPELMAIMYSTLGDIYNVSKQFELSDNAYDKSLQLQPNDATVLNNYAYYLSERGKRLEDAEKMSLKSLQLKPGEATFLDTYGWILYKKGDYSGAKDYVEKAIQKAAEHADGALYDHLGNIYYHLENKEKAIENWKISREKGNNDPQIDKKISEGKLYE